MGASLRHLILAGPALAGTAGVRALLGKVRGDRLPILLGGNSRGTMATGWAMARNFDRTCDYDLTPTPACGRPVFARAAVFHRKTARGGRARSDMKSLVATTDDLWDPSSEPKAVAP